MIKRNWDFFRKIDCAKPSRENIITKHSEKNIFEVKKTATTQTNLKYNPDNG